MKILSLYISFSINCFDTPKTYWKQAYISLSIRLTFSVSERLIGHVFWQEDSSAYEKLFAPTNFHCDDKLKSFPAELSCSWIFQEVSLLLHRWESMSYVDWNRYEYYKQEDDTLLLTILNLYFVLNGLFRNGSWRTSLKCWAYNCKNFRWIDTLSIYKTQDSKSATWKDADIYQCWRFLRERSSWRTKIFFSGSKARFNRQRPRYNLNRKFYLGTYGSSTTFEQYSPASKQT